MTCAASSAPVNVTTGSNAHTASPVAAFTARTVTGARVCHRRAQTCARTRAAAAAAGSCRAVLGAGDED
ncbi:hypothetical protein ACFQ10_51150 [Streptomyces indonesiensis]